MKYLTSLKKKDLAGKTCLLRVDLNIKSDEMKSGKGKQPLRLVSILPTIKYLISNQAKVVILSHRGRPEVTNGKYETAQFSLKIFAKPISNLLKKPVNFVGLDFEMLKKLLVASRPGSVFLLGNLRFISAEEENNKKFAEKLAALGDFYVNDAFAVSHRANTSVEAITDFLPSYAGLLLAKEIEKLDQSIKNPKKPLVVILGGAKISDKIGLIKNLYNQTNTFLIGGGIANTFFDYQGLPVGNSIYEKIQLDPIIVKGLKSKIILPIDTMIENKKILDIGPETVKLYKEVIKKAGTIIWNGPMGYIEDKKFRKGSEEIMSAIFQGKGFALIGGGETSSLVTKAKKNVYISTGGGAMLEYLAGIKLPGITALNRNKSTL